jgi:hypothetical protein
MPMSMSILALFRLLYLRPSMPPPSEDCEWVGRQAIYILMPILNLRKARTHLLGNAHDVDTAPQSHTSQQQQPPSHPHTHTHVQPQTQRHAVHAYAASLPHRSKALDDCGAPLAPSTSSHKEERGSMLSRLGSLKRWGHTSGSPSTSGLSNLDPNGKPSSSSTSHSRLGGLGMLSSGLGLSRLAQDSVSPRVFSPRVFSSRLPAFSGGSKVDLYAKNERAGAGAVGGCDSGVDA